MKNIVICCDGTGNEISENISNVLKLYRCLRKTKKTEPYQAVFYDPGVGTLARPDPWHKLRQDFTAILGLATGYGLDDNVLAAYIFLVAQLRRGRPHLSVRLLPRRLHRARAGRPDPQGRADLAAAGQSRRQRPHRLQADPAAGTGDRRRRRPRRAGRCRATRTGRWHRHRTTTRRSSRASCRRAGPPSISSASGTRSRASSCRGPTVCTGRAWRSWRSPCTIRA